jgi:hypothetical protein
MVFKVQLVDIDKRGYLLLKHSKSKKIELKDNENFLVDKVKLIINKKGEIVLISTSLTVSIIISKLNFFILTYSWFRCSEKSLMMNLR